MAAKESIGKTISVVVGVCLVCSIIVSGTAIGLRDKQKSNAKLDIRTNILEAAGVLDKANGDVLGYFDENIETKYLDLSTNKLVEKPAGYTTIVAAARNPETSIKPENDFAKVLRRPNVVPVYYSKAANGVDTVVVPVYGAGLWGMMRGFLGVSPDGVTAKSLVYYEHMETPGLGAEILNPKWKALWNGKKLYNEKGQVAIKVVKGGAKTAGEAYGVDALSGATLTSNGVQATLDYWLSDNGYQVFLANKPWKS